MPFFAMLGYDVFNPLEFTPEYTADDWSMEARVVALEQGMEELTRRVDAIDKELEGVAHIRPADSSYKEMVDGLMRSAVEDAYKK